MTLTDLLTDLERLGVALEADGAALRYWAPGPIPNALYEELKRLKPELLAYLATLSPEPSLITPLETTDGQAGPALQAHELELITWRLGFIGQTARRYPLAEHPDLYAQILEHAHTIVTPSGWEWAIVAHPADEMLACSYDVDEAAPEEPADLSPCRKAAA